jgi:hypothetical protein
VGETVGGRTYLLGEGDAKPVDNFVVSNRLGHKERQAGRHRGGGDARLLAQLAQSAEPGQYAQRDDAKKRQWCALERLLLRREAPALPAGQQRSA